MEAGQPQAGLGQSAEGGAGFPDSRGRMDGRRTDNGLEDLLGAECRRNAKDSCTGGGAVNEPSLIDIFAMFAMLKMKWEPGEDDKNAEDCYAVARAMMRAKERNDNE